MSSDDQRDRDELEWELRRVGVTWTSIGELCRLNEPGEPPSPDGSFAIELNYADTTAFLRTLPDGCGPAAFLAACFERTESLRERAIAAMRAEARKRGELGRSYGEADA